MNWQTILKQPKLRTGSKITTNLGTDSKLEDNDWINRDSSNMKYFYAGHSFFCEEYNSFLCNEKVACVVLKLLERLKSQGSGMFEEDVVDGDDVYLVEIVLESTKKLKTTGWDQWFDDAQDAAFVILIEGLTLSGAEYYQVTYESEPKNPNRTATGYKDYSEDDYKRMIKVLHKGVFG